MRPRKLEKSGSDGAYGFGSPPWHVGFASTRPTPTSGKINRRSTAFSKALTTCHKISLAWPDSSEQASSGISSSSRRLRLLIRTSSVVNASMLGSRLALRIAE